MLRACYTNSKEEEEEEEAAASAVCITRKANKNNNNNNRCVKKQHLYYGPLCSFPYARAKMSPFSFVFFLLLSFLSFLSLLRQRTERAAPNAKEQKTENILLCSHHKAFFPRDIEAVLLALLKSNQMKQTKRKIGRKEERIRSIATTTILHLNKTVIIIA
jgi:hypothetical protein